MSGPSAPVAPSSGNGRGTGTRELDRLSSPLLRVRELDGMVCLVQLDRPPANYFDVPLIEEIVRVYREIDASPAIRAIVLASNGRHFCAGADFGGTAAAGFDADGGARALYAAGHALFLTDTPVVAAVQGAAIGGGVGLALTGDFRIATPRTRFTANFARLGLHHGFGLSVTLPRVVGPQRATDLLLTGRDVDGQEALRIGLCDRLVDDDELTDSAIDLARQLAATAPLAAASIRRTLRRGLADAVAEAIEHERAEQAVHRGTTDFAEGVAAATERRPARFIGA